MKSANIFLYSSTLQPRQPQPETTPARRAEKFNLQLLLRTRRLRASQTALSFASVWFFSDVYRSFVKFVCSHPPGIMTRRSCAIYATGIVCAHLLILGIALVVAQVFQTMIHSRLKKVSLLLYCLFTFTRFINCFLLPPSPHHLSHRGLSVTAVATGISLVVGVHAGSQDHQYPDLLKLYFLF